MHINSNILIALHRVGLSQGLFDTNHVAYQHSLQTIQEIRRKKDFEKPIPYRAIYKLIETIPTNIDEHIVGWELGRSLRTFDLGMLGYYLYSCKHMFFAYEKLTQYQFLLSDIINFNIEIKENEVEWTLSTPFSFKLGDKRVLRIMSIIDVVYRHAIVCNLVYRRFSPNAVEMVYSLEDDEGRTYLESKLGCPLVHSSEGISKIVYDIADVNCPIPSQNPLLFHKLEPIMIEAINQYHNRQGEYKEIVRRLILSNISYADFSFDLIALKLNMSARNLQRQLKKEGTNYISLLESCRKEMAEVYLKKGLKNKDIAHKLGYIETNSFVRAFRNWFGVSISDYRKQLFKT